MPDSRINSVVLTIYATSDQLVGSAANQHVEFQAELTPEFYAAVLDQWHRYYNRLLANSKANPAQDLWQT